MTIRVGRAAAVAALFLNLSAASAAEVSCNRECLAGFMTTYLTALVKHDPASLPTTRNVKYTENGVRLTLGDGLWQTASAMPTYRVDVIDEETGQVGLHRPHQRERQHQLVWRAPQGRDGQAGLADRGAGQSQPFGCARSWRGCQGPHRATPPDDAAHSGQQARGARNAGRCRQCLLHRTGHRGQRPQCAVLAGLPASREWRHHGQQPGCAARTPCSTWDARPSSTPAFR